MIAVALIFARGNSKGIKNKNLLKFKNTTLLGNAIKQAKQMSHISKVFVSSDSKKILKHAKKNKAEIIIRPNSLAKDNSPEIDAWRHAITHLNDKYNLTPDYIVSVPTTCPLRSVKDLNNCLKKIIKKRGDLILTITKSSRNPFFNIVTKKKNKLVLVSNLFSKSKKYSRRQDAPVCYDLTTACYVFKPSYIMNNNNLFLGKVDFVEIPKERGVDIDDKYDYKLVRLLSKK